MYEPISLETEAAAAAAAKWRGYADQVEERGSHQHVPIDELGRALGDVYGDYVEAKAGEYEARRLAYHGVAARARGHADRLDGTRQIFSDTDEEHATVIRGVLDA